MSTRIVAVRHAKPASDGYSEDALRPLSDEGRQMQIRMAQLFKRDGLHPKKIFSSPLLRAKQTAQIIADAFDSDFEILEALGPSFYPDEILDQFPPAAQDETIYLIGHEPSLSNFVNSCVGNNVLPDGLSKGTGCVIAFDSIISYGKARFIHYYRP